MAQRYEVAEHDLDHRAQAEDRGAERRAGQRKLGDRRVEDALGAEAGDEARASPKTPPAGATSSPSTTTEGSAPSSSAERVADGGAKLELLAHDANSVACGAAGRGTARRARVRPSASRCSRDARVSRARRARSTPSPSSSRCARDAAAGRARASARAPPLGRYAGSELRVAVRGGTVLALQERRALAARARGRAAVRAASCTARRSLPSTSAAGHAVGAHAGDEVRAPR